MTSMQTSPKAESAAASTVPGPLDPLDTFARRHLGPTPAEEKAMLATLGCSSMAELIDTAIPAGIRLRRELDIADPTNGQKFATRGETETLDKMKRRIDFDLEYLRNWSFLLDLRIILRTVGLIRKDPNAY